MAHIHEIGADNPEECLMWLTNEVPVNLQFLYSCYMSSTEFEKVSFYQAYADYKKALQILTYQSSNVKDPPRWVLKCPIHTFYTKEIQAAFPDAKLIWYVFMFVQWIVVRKKLEKNTRKAAFILQRTLSSSHPNSDQLVAYCCVSVILST